MDKICVEAVFFCLPIDPASFRIQIFAFTDTCFQDRRDQLSHSEARVLEKQSAFARSRRRSVQSMQTPFWFVISNRMVGIYQSEFSNI